MILKVAVAYAALAGALGVILGAFGAHGLRDSLEPRLIQTFETAVQYQLIHALALLMVAILWGQVGRSLALEISMIAFMAGILLFSGSLYGLVLTEMRWLGPVTPLGGLCFIVGWFALLTGGLQKVG